MFSLEDDDTLLFPGELSPSTSAYESSVTIRLVALSTLSTGVKTRSSTNELTKSIWDNALSVGSQPPCRIYNELSPSKPIGFNRHNGCQRRVVTPSAPASTRTGVWTQQPLLGACHTTASTNAHGERDWSAPSPVIGSSSSVLLWVFPGSPGLMSSWRAMPECDADLIVFSDVVSRK